MDDAAVFAIVIPRENASDDTVTVVECLFEDRSMVHGGDCVSICENSKTAFEITTDKSGYIFYLRKSEESVPVGATLAVIAQSEDFSIAEYLVQEAICELEKTALSKERHEGGALIGSLRENHTHFSNRALSLIQQSALAPDVFTGQVFVTEADVASVIRKSSTVNGIHDYAMETTDQKVSDIVVFGGGGHAKMCIDLLNVMGGYRIIGIIDRDLPLNSSVLGVPVIGREMDFPEIYASGVKNAVLGIGAADTHIIREKLFYKLKSIGFFLPNLIHPKACVEQSVFMGEGNQVMANATVGSSAKIGHNCIINSGAIVSHDCVLEDNVHISPGAVLAGWVSVGSNSLIGMNATVFMKISIGQNVTVFNGNNVMANIKPGSVIR